jgi:DNA-binding transcriptional LysR family regulator
MVIMITSDSPKSLRTGGVPRPFRRRNALRIYADFLAIDRVLLYHLLRFYNEHPQARVELGTPASIDRIRSRELL